MDAWVQNIKEAMEKRARDLNVNSGAGGFIIIGNEDINNLMSPIIFIIGTGTEEASVEHHAGRDFVKMAFAQVSDILVSARRHGICKKVGTIGNRGAAVYYDDTSPEDPFIVASFFESGSVDTNLQVAIAGHYEYIRECMEVSEVPKQTAVSEILGMGIFTSMLNN